MLHIRLICVGRLKEKFYIDASREYLKRLSAFCKIETEEIAEAHVPESPSKGDIETALKTEAAAIEQKLVKGAAVIALCIEGTQTDSGGMAAFLGKYASDGVSKLCFVIGGSFGLHTSVKERAAVKLSMSLMTFPHHLARIMLLEQIYRGFKIAQGSKYHK